MATEAARVLPGLQVTLWPEPFEADDVLAVAAWHPPAGLLGTLPKLQMVASIGAGTEHILRCPDLPADVAVTRIVDPAQARGMAEYVLWAALYYHRGFDQMAAQQRQGLWHMPPQGPARAFRVGIMGLGGMGLQTALCLRDFGFAVSGWSRSAHAVEDLHTFAGDAALPEFLAPLDMVVCLLPLTPATHGLCNAGFFARMKTGAALVNVGRGEQVVLPDLLAALDSGHLRGAVLDVFDREPLQADDALWRHPKICLTPHMASSASDQTIAQQIVTNTLRLRQGLLPLHTMDRQRGY
ncbi:glyoxylate/hydroxypyruvate reductase A [Rhodoferax lacus]|uniref:Glyoxylate/hydroxypyruvate reductase A n=2 Tax=Rhodoferax lacus TaxID=2184758 RepID=A0A3E1RDW9_9BURK|nr:glyoxylate/hydroxypyruvate reductase A [Rhodoferax lacus]